MDGETHRMLDGRLADIGSGLNELTNTVRNLGALLDGFFRAYAEAESEKAETTGTLAATAWSGYLKEEEES